MLVGNFVLAGSQLTATEIIRLVLMVKNNNPCLDLNKNHLNQILLFQAFSNDKVGVSNLGQLVQTSVRYYFTLFIKYQPLPENKIRLKTLVKKNPIYYVSFIDDTSDNTSPTLPYQL